MVDYFRKIIPVRLLAVGFLIGTSFFICQASQAATLYLSPNSGTYAIGKTFTITTYVSSPTQAMNTAAVNLSFPSQLLEVTSISKSGSIFNLSPQEPSFSAGSAHFEGLILNPGYTGSGGKLVSVTFRTKAEGTATIAIVGASVLANDGLGTEILTGSGKSTITIKGAADTPPVVESGSETGTPSLPIVTSSSHPDQNSWYAVSKAQLAWKLPAGVNGLSYLVTDRPISNPGSVAIANIASLTIPNLPNGLNYFHLRFRNSKGWGPIAHFALRTDTIAPEDFVVTVVKNDSPDNPRPTISLTAQDEISGIGHYELKIAAGEFVTIPNEEIKDGNYTLPIQKIGSHTAIVKAFDKANNQTTSRVEFVIKPLPTPEITKYPRTVTVGDSITLDGQTTPQTDVTISFKASQGKITTQSMTSDVEGNFQMTWQQPLQAGIYLVSATIANLAGAQSLESATVSIQVNEIPLFRVGGLAFGYVALVLLLLALLSAVIAVSWYLWHLLHRLHQHLNRLSGQAEEQLQGSFRLVSHRLHEDLRLLARVKSKDQFKKEKDKIIRQLRQDMRDAEKYAVEKITKIENNKKA